VAGGRPSIRHPMTRPAIVTHDPRNMGVVAHPRTRPAMVTHDPRNMNVVAHLSYIEEIKISPRDYCAGSASIYVSSVKARQRLGKQVLTAKNTHEQHKSFWSCNFYKQIVSQFNYLGTTTTTNQNLFQEENKRRLNSGNAC
jgi:hypothetical protein